MHIGLVDLRWEGHHTPYIIFISRYLLENGHRVTFVTRNDHPYLDELPSDEDLDIIATTFPSTAINGDAGFIASLYEQWVRLRQLRSILTITQQAKVDLVHLLDYNRAQIPLRVATTVPGVPSTPIIASLHRDVFTDYERQGIGARIVSFATRAAIDSCLRDGTISFVTVHTDTIRDRIIETVTAATRETIRTIPAPTPSPPGDVSKGAARRYLDLPSGRPLLLFFGGLRAEKGPDILFEAVRSLERPCGVIFAGEEADFTQADVRHWQSQVKSPLKIHDRVGYIPEDEVNYYFLAADALILPYRRERGISGPLRRACMAGTHLIGSDESDIGSVIERNNLGQTFERKNPGSLRRTILEFLDNPSQYPTEDLVPYGKSQHWRETGRALETLYRSALDRHNPKKIRHDA